MVDDLGCPVVYHTVPPGYSIYFVELDDGSFKFLGYKLGPIQSHFQQEYTSPESPDDDSDDDLPYVDEFEEESDLD